MRKEYARRRALLQERIRAKGWLGAMLLKPQNHRYLTGFYCAVNNVERLMALLVPAEGEPVFVLPSVEATLGQAADVEKSIGFYYTEAFVKLHEGFDILGWAKGSGKVGVERSFLTVDKAEAIQGFAPAVEMVDCSGLMAGLRVIKGAREIEFLERAARAADSAWEATRAFIRPGVTEAEIAGFLMGEMAKAGADEPSFFPTVQAGSNATLPNMCPTERPLVAGEIVVVDFGAAYQGLVTDMCRCVAVGGVDTLSARAREIHSIVAKAQEAAIAMVAPGRPAAQVQRAAEAVIEKAGYGPYFQHAVGHGVGYNVHEAPSVAGHNEEPLQAGMVLAIEPGIYVDDIGVRIEDVVLVTENGHRVLTTSGRGL